MIKNNGYCPECEMKQYKHSMRLNRSDFWECPNCNLQMLSLGRDGLILDFRGFSDFRSSITYAIQELDNLILKGVEDGTLNSNEHIFDDFVALEDYITKKVGEYLPFSLKNLIETYTKGNKKEYKRQSQYFKIDFDDSRIIKVLEKRDILEKVEYRNSYIHYYSFLPNIFRHYKNEEPIFPEMGMSLNILHIVNKFFPRGVNIPNVKKRIEELIIEIIKIIYMKTQPILNPWYSLVEDYKKSNSNLDSFILKSEQEIIKKFNANQKDEKYLIKEKIRPCPYKGDIHNAPIIILGLNPGYSKQESQEFYTNKDFDLWTMNNLVHHYTPEYKPFFALEQEFITFSKYWYEKLKSLIDIFGQDLVADSCCLVEYFPYHSEKFKSINKSIYPDYLPSQKYTFELVKQAMERNAIILITRSKNLWCEAVEGLEHYPNTFIGNSYLNPVVSPNNYPKDFDKIVSAIEKLKKD